MQSSPKVRHILDTVALRAFAFAHPEGLSLLMDFLDSPRLYFAREVYAFDENADLSDDEVSELARGLRYARRKKELRHSIWLENATQLGPLREKKKIVVLKLNLPLTRERLRLQDTYGIGRGEAATIALAHRIGSTAVFLSSDGKAVHAARELGVETLTLVEVLDLGTRRGIPCSVLEELLQGLHQAKFGLKQEDILRFSERCF